MGSQLKKRYGLFTAITMVVGIVIGSGVFFKAEKILTATGGNLPLGILAWIIGGIIMLVCAYTFSIMAGKYEFVNGVVDYADVIVGKKYGYYIAWFLATIYYPAITSVLAWVSSRYFCVLLGFDIFGAECMIIAGFFMVASFVMNAISPTLAGKFQVSTTVIKLIPLLLMAIVGLIAGLGNGMLVENFTSIPSTDISAGNALFSSVVAAAFAFEGWIIATIINSELKDAKRNLPKALVIGTVIVMAVYILYYIGLAGAVPNAALMESGEAGTKLAFTTVFSNIGGTLLNVLVVISCLGTLNGLMVGSTRGFYAIAARGVGFAPETFKQVDKKTGMPHNAAILGLLFVSFWLLYFYGANLTNWFGPVRFDSSELPIVTLYAAYIPMFILFIKREKDLSFFQRFVAPVLSICGSVFMVVAAIFAHGVSVAWFLALFAVFMTVGVFFSKEQPDEPLKTKKH